MLYTDTEAGDPLICCIYTVIAQLVEDLYALPLSLVILFHAMQDSVQLNADVPHSSRSVALKVSCGSLL